MTPSELRALAEAATKIDEKRDALLVAVASMPYLARQRLADIGELAAAVPALLDQLAAAEAECAALRSQSIGGHGIACRECSNTRDDLHREQLAREALEAQLATVSAARDAACDLAEFIYDGGSARGFVTNHTDPLRAVGKEPK